LSVCSALLAFTVAELLLMTTDDDMDDSLNGTYQSVLLVREAHELYCMHTPKAAVIERYMVSGTVVAFAFDQCQLTV
jgi:hypothetical protein